jgi:hypothetical protein
MAKKRGRPAGFKMTEEHRTKIANSQILKYLVEHVEGKREMTTTQVTAGLGLLKKIMADKTESKNETQHTGDVTFQTIIEEKK